jgi:hypothetical protein
VKFTGYKSRIPELSNGFVEGVIYPYDTRQA